MHHGMRHLDARWPAIGNHAANLAFENFQQRPGQVGVLFDKVDSCRELAFEMLYDIQHFRLVGTADQYGRGPKDFFGNFRVLQQRGSLNREQSSATTVRARRHRTSPDRAHSRMF